MDSLEHFLSEVYPKIWHKAYDAGEKARKEGLPRVCNLGEGFVTPGDNILKVYKSAWEQGWDGYKIPEIFGRMEKILDELPTEKI